MYCTLNSSVFSNGYNYNNIYHDWNVMTMIVLTRITHLTQNYIIPEMTNVGIQPLVTLSTCNRRIISDGSSTTIPIGHTLLTVARENQTVFSNTTTGEYSEVVYQCTTYPIIVNVICWSIGSSLVWLVDVPGYFSSGQCIEVLVQGSGFQIHQTKIQISTAVELTNTVENVEEISIGNEGIAAKEQLSV